MLTNFFPHITTITIEQVVAKLGVEVVDSILTAAIADPDTMRQFTNDISPLAEPVQDYLIEVDIQYALFDELRAICQYYNILLNATIFAVFMVAPVLEIRTFFNCIRREFGLADIAYNFAKYAVLYSIIVFTLYIIKAYIFFFFPLNLSKFSPNYPTSYSQYIQLL